MSRLDAIEAIAGRRAERFVDEQRAWDAVQERQYARMYAEQMRKELWLHGPERPAWNGRMRVPPGLVPRDAGLRELRIACYARLLARRQVRQQRMSEMGW